MALGSLGKAAHWLVEAWRALLGLGNPRGGKISTLRAQRKESNKKPFCELNRSICFRNLIFNHISSIQDQWG
jgi:hypothetical protein